MLWWRYVKANIAYSTVEIALITVRASFYGRSITVYGSVYGRSITVYGSVYVQK